MSKSVEELFRGAPPDATHYAAYCHYKKVNDVWMVHMDGDEWDKSSSMYNGDIKPADIVKRPQPKPWSGPEDGLPPVGTVCELRTKRGGWGEAEIKYQGRRGICVWLWVRRDGNSEQVEWAESPDKLEFRAIRTPEQIAAEKRETAIRELMDIAQVDCRVTAARLVDAGFKREVA